MTRSQKWFDRCLLVFVVSVLVGPLVYLGVAHAKVNPAHGGRTHPCPTLAKCRSLVAHQRAAIAWQREARRHANAVTYQSDVRTAIELASRVSGVPLSNLYTIARCESRLDPFNVLGQYEGLYQLGAYHRSLPDIRGLNPFNPYVNAMHAALFIARNGDGQWSCRANGTVHPEG